MDDQFDAPRRSLLDVVQEKLQNQGKTVVLSRIVYLGSIDPKIVSKEDVLAMHEDVFVKVREEMEMDMTGLLMCYSNTFIHVLEAQTKALLAFLREVNSIAPHERPFTAIRVISSTEDIPYRAFPKWSSTFIAAEDDNKPAVYADQDAIVEAASGVNLNLIKIGKSLSAMTSAEADSAVSNLAGAYIEVPVVTKCLGLVSNAGVPSLEEFLDIFDTPVDIDLDSENVWPMPIPITFG